MKVDDKIIERLTLLIQKADVVIATYKANRDGVIGQNLSREKYHEWRVQSLSALVDIVGENHTYVENFDKVTEKGAYQLVAQSGRGIIVALKEDVENGYLDKIRNLVVAEIFTDLMDMAQHLIEKGFKDASAMLCGAVLEDGLRRIAIAQNITVRSRDDLSVLNQKCAQAGVYNSIVRKQVELWTAIRNHADHGRFSDYSLEDVKDTHRNIVDFLAKYL